MNPDFEKIKNVLAVIRRVFLSVCALVITLGVLILLRSLINAEFLRSYNSGRYSSIPENLLPYLPFGENYVAPYNLGNVEYQRGNYDKAIYYYALAYQNGPPEHPEHDEECRIRVNLALSMCHTIDFDNLDYSDAEAVAEAMVTLQQARAILTEAECASEPVGSDDGHYRDADKLKHDPIPTRAAEMAAAVRTRTRTAATVRMKIRIRTTAAAARTRKTLRVRRKKNSASRKKRPARRNSRRISGSRKRTSRTAAAHPPIITST